MLKYKLKENCISPDSNEPIKDYLKSLGIEKVDSFINQPPKEDELNPFLLDNMERCVKEIHNGFMNKKKFFVQIDSDVDGMTSSAIFYRYFKNYYEDANIIWRIHDGKEHGVIIPTVPEDVDYIILPDSGSMQIDEQKQLSVMGKKVIILDHHNVTETVNDENIILVNNQVSKRFPNKNLSGAGVVFKLIQAHNLTYPDIYKKAYLYYDLAALGILSDMMDMRSTDNNYIVYQGLHNINNELFKAILHRQEYSISDFNNPTKIDVVFYVSPLINGVIRAGTQEEKSLLFKGFIEEPISESIESEYRGEKRKEKFYDYVARVAYNVKNRQNTMKEKCFEFLKNKIDTEHLADNKVITVIVSKDDKVTIPQNITGLIAMELLKHYNKPTLVLRPKNDNGEMVYSGSGRGKQFEGFSSFLQFVRDSDYSEYGEGHNWAFGASIRANELDNFNKECNERLKDVDFNTDFIEVDAIFNISNINHKMLYEFAENNQIYGNSIPQPKVAIEGLITKNNIRIMGKDMSSIRLTIDNLPCVKFKDLELANRLLECNSAKFKLIGRPQVNEFMGYKNVQLIIDDIEIEPIKTNSLF